MVTLLGNKYYISSHLLHFHHHCFVKLCCFWNRNLFFHIHWAKGCHYRLELNRSQSSFCNKCKKYWYCMGYLDLIYHVIRLELSLYLKINSLARSDTEWDKFCILPLTVELSSHHLSVWYNYNDNSLWRKKWYNKTDRRSISW